MSEATEMKDMETEVEIAEKPYTFRKLDSTDMFLMFKILGKIGIKEFKKCFEGDGLDALMASFKGSVDRDKAMTAVGVSIGFDAVDLILNGLPKAEQEIYSLLARVSGMKEDEIKNDMILFTEMVIDFVKKDEFPAFIKVVSRLFK